MPASGGDVITEPAFASASALAPHAADTHQAVEQPPGGTTMRTHLADEATIVLADSIDIPGLGYLPVNAFLLQAAQPVLVDTGLPTSREEFLTHLWSLCEPTDLRWIWLTHPDRDHTGSLPQILHAAPQARLVTTFVGLGIL